MLVLSSTTEPLRPWHAKALRTIATDAYDHPDYDAWRAIITEVAALEDRMRQIAGTVLYLKPVNVAADQVQDVIDEIIDAAWRWNDQREDREAADRQGNALDARRENVT